MRRKVVASILALIMCAMMVPPQVGLTVRDADMGQETVSEPAAEGSALDVGPQENAIDQGESGESAADTAYLPEPEGNPADTADTVEPIEVPSAPTAPADDAAADEGTEGSAEQTAEDVPAPEQGEPSSDPAAQETEQSEMDAPEDVPDDGQMTEPPAADTEPAAGEGPDGEEESEAGNQPSEEDESDVYTLSEVESVIEDGISLASLQKLMPVSIVSEKPIPSDNFRFLISDSSGATVKSYENYASLKAEYSEIEWIGAAGGNVSGAMFPQIKGKVFENLYLEGTIIEKLGIVTVTVSDESGAETQNDYIWFSASASGDETSAMVLPTSEEGKYLFEVRYVPQEYDITYEVCLNGVDASQKYPLETIFGAGRAVSTKDGTAAVDVTIPTGFTGKVYIGDKERVDSQLCEQYPIGTPTYGNYPLGAELVYVETGTGASVDSAHGPGYYSTFGTYQVGSKDDPVSAPQIVRVVLEEKESYIFDPGSWMKTSYTGNGSRIENGTSMTKVVLTNESAQPRTDVQYKRNSDGTYHLIWTFVTVSGDNMAGGWILDALEINGVGLKIPYVDYSSSKQEQVTAETVLPSGMTIHFLAKSDAAEKTTSYHLTIMNLSHDVVITGGSLHAAGGERELVLEDSTGTEVQFYFCDPKGEDGKWVPAVQSQPVSAAKAGKGIHYNAGDPNHKVANVRFKLKKGYEWHSGSIGVTDVVFTNQEGTRISWGIKGESDICSDYVEDEGWYYLRLGTGENYYDGAPTIGRLGITAKPVRYVIQYLDGSEAAINNGVSFGASGITDMPAFADGNLIQGTWDYKSTDTLDGNHGSYYSVAERTGSYFDSRISNTATIHGSMPRDSAANRPARFQGWIITDANGNALDEHGVPTTDDGQFITCQPGSALPLSKVSACGKLFDKVERLYVIYLTARWDARAPSYTYYVTFNTTNTDGAVSKRIPVNGFGTQFEEADIAAGASAGVTYEETDWYVSRNDNYFRQQEGSARPKGVDVVFNSEGEQAKLLMSGDLKWYKFDGSKNSSRPPGQYLWPQVLNGGEVDVWLISNLGRLSITKTVDSENPEELEKAFPFTVIFNLPEDDPGTQGNEGTYFSDGDSCRVLYTINDSGNEQEQELILENLRENQYMGTLTLKNGQTASFVLPGDTVYSITELFEPGQYRIEKSGDTGIITVASPGAVASFKNVPTGIVVEKDQVETAGADGAEEISTPAELITIGSGDHVKYSISITNRDEKRGVTVTVTDAIPNAKGDDGSRLKLKVNEASVSESGQYTPDDDTAGTVKWENVTIDPGQTKTFSFTVTAPVVNNLNTYINAADVDYRYDDGSQGCQKTNAVSLMVVKDWLRIGKVLPYSSRGEAGDRDFVFQITLSGSTETVSYPYIGLAAESYEGQDVTVPENGMLTFTDGAAEVKLKEGQAIAIYGIPEDTGYIVTEERVEGFRTSVTKQSTREESAGSSASGEISVEASDWLIFKNVPYGVSLSKTQTVIGTGASGDIVSVMPGDRINYCITIENIDTEMPAQNVTVTDTVPAGLTVETISDSGSQADDSITWVIPEIGKGGEVTVSFAAVVPQLASDESFVNTARARIDGAAEAVSNAVTATLQTGSLSIEKIVDGGPEQNEDTFSFTVELTRASDGVPLTGSYPYASDDASISGKVANGGTITLRNGETVTIEDLPIDTRWTVTETGPFERDDHGYEGQAPQSGTLNVQAPDGSAAFSNSWYGLYSLTYDGNGNTEGAPPADGSRYRDYEIAALQQPAADFRRENAVFLGWSETNSASPLTSREAAENAGITDEVTFMGSNVTVFAVWGADVDGDGVPDYDASVKPSATPESSATPGPSATPEPSVSPEPGATPEPSDTPEPVSTPEPSSTLPPGVTSGPFFSPQPTAYNADSGEEDGGRTPDTGDHTRTALWSAVLAGSLVGAAAVCALFRRRRTK